MSQQLNLLYEDRRGVNPVVVALGAWGFVLLCLFAVWGINQLRLSAARESEAVAAQQLAEARAIIKKREDAKVALAGQIAALQPAANAAQQLLDRANGLGSWKGYASQFMTLANVTETGLWLTDVDISKSGKVIKLQGNALNNDIILRYSRSLNDAFADQGVKFTILEMTPQTSGKGSGSAPALSSTKFSIH